MNLEENVTLLMQKIKDICDQANRGRGEVSVLAAIKKQSDASITRVINSGIRLLGENQLQESQRRQLSFNEECEYHFIGGLQSNKIRKIINAFDVIQTLENENHLLKIQQICYEEDRCMPCFVQVNIGSEKQKHGVDPEEVLNFSSLVMEQPNILFKGLMCVAPYSDDREKVRPYFKRMREFNNKLKQVYYNKYGGFLSMGMSHDYDVAIEEGSHIVRIGELIFGERD